jgi:hypothetical protein
MFGGYWIWTPLSTPKSTHDSKSIYILITWKMKIENGVLKIKCSQIHVLHFFCWWLKVWFFLNNDPIQCPFKFNGWIKKNYILIIWNCSVTNQMIPNIYTAFLVLMALKLFKTMIRSDVRLNLTVRLKKKRQLLNWNEN